MNFLSKILDQSKSTRNCVAVLDIGTESIKALILKIDPKEEKGIVIGMGEERHKEGSFQSGAMININGVTATCQKAIEKASQLAKSKPKRVIVGVGGGFIKEKTTTVTYERTTPKVKINLTELKNIIHKVQWKAFDVIKQESSRETGKRETGIKLISAAIVEIMIDGYQVLNPLGIQGKNVSISVFNTYAPLVHLGALQTVIDNLGLDLLSITTESYAIAKSAKTKEVIESGAIFINVGGEITDVILARNGNIGETKMFNMGGRTFTKRLMRELGVNFQKAEEIKIDYSHGRLREELSNKIEKVFSADCSIWLSGIKLSLAEFSETDLLPSKILLCGGGSALPGIEKALKKSSWTKNLPFAKKPKIDFMRPCEMVNIIDRTGKLDSVGNVTPAGLASLVLNLSKNEESLSKILKRTVRMVQG